MPYILQACSSCEEPFEPPDGTAHRRTPHSLPCGHIVCLPCARRPTLTPATSMSVCRLCHVPYTKRDVFSLKIAGAANRNLKTDGVIWSPPVPGSSSALDPKLSTSLVRLPGLGAVSSAESMLQARIHELERTLALRDGQIRDWRRQFDKNSQSLLMHVREVKELKKEVLDWWRRFESKDIELQALRHAFTTRHPRLSTPIPPATRSKPPDGSRVITYEVPELSPTTLFGMNSTPPPYS